MSPLGAIALLALARPAAAEGLDCPSGTAEATVSDDASTELWCTRPDGVRHGPYQRRSLSGRILERGFWEDGVRAGSWRYYDVSGKVVRTGQMSSGHPDGAWTHFDPTGAPSATITHGRFPPATSAPPRPADPRHRWQVDLGTTPTAWWRAGDASVAVSVGSDRLVLLSVETGAITADIPLPAPLRPGLVFEGDRILAVTGPGELFTVDLDPDGGGTWRRVRTPLGVTDALGSAGPDAVVVRDGRGRLSSVSLDSGDSLWSSRLFVDDTRPALTSASAVAVRERREVRAVTLEGGAFVWQARMPSTVRAVGSVGDVVLALLDSGEVQALAASTGAPIWSLPLPIAAGVRPELHALDGTVWVSTPHEAWALDPVRGVVRASHVARPPTGQAAADLSVGASATCTTGRQGGIRCGPGDWELDTPPPALPAMVGVGVVLVAAQSGTITALDPAVSAAIAHGSTSDADLLVDDVLEATIGWEGESLAVEIPWVVVERERPDDACSVTTAAVQLPDPAHLWPAPPPTDDAPPAAPPPPEPPAVLWLDDLVLHDDLGEGLFTVHPDWLLDPAGTTWRMSWWHQHRPTLTALLATLGTPSDAALVDALVRCDGPPARFDGIAQLDDGLRALRLTGSLEITPHAHSLDGEPGCLLDVSVGGQDQGAWSSASLPAWTEISLEVHGETLPDDLPLTPDLPARVEGSVSLDAYEPWALDRTHHELDGVLELRIDGGDPRGPILRAFDGTRLVLEVPVPDLTYGAVAVEPDGTVVPDPTIEDHVHLERSVPFPVSGAADGSDGTWRVLWTRSSCLDELEPGTHLPPDDRAPPRPEAVPSATPAPMKRPAPLPPARSRWRKDRTDKTGG